MLCRSHRNGVIYSIKSIYRCTLDSNTMQQLIREVKIQSFTDHPNLVKIYNFFVDEDSAYLVLEPCLGGNLFNYLKKHEKVSEKLVKEWIKQICSAV
jgi:serine/threonine protein kinase